MIQAASRSQFNQRQSDRKVRHTGKAALILLSRNCTEHVSQHKVSPKIVWGPWNLWQYVSMGSLSWDTQLAWDFLLRLFWPTLRERRGFLLIATQAAKKAETRHVNYEFQRVRHNCCNLLGGFKFLVLFHTDPNICQDSLKLWVWNHQSVMNWFRRPRIRHLIQRLSLWTQGLQPQFSANL